MSCSRLLSTFQMVLIYLIGTSAQCREFQAKASMLNLKRPNGNSSGEPSPENVAAEDWTTREPERASIFQTE
ncbi:hypothetical protein DL96DRAFT_1595389 [Flagelloscypha sp. PMI_526]|nr:hypothetical protein DL96DRAFT_1595389 [Flagelloscypha sp. PMI_526]